MVLHEDLRHVNDGSQSFYAFTLPGTHRLGQDLQLQLLPLSHLLTLSLRS